MNIDDVNYFVTWLVYTAVLRNNKQFADAASKKE